MAAGRPSLRALTFRASIPSGTSLTPACHWILGVQLSCLRILAAPHPLRLPEFGRLVHAEHLCDVRDHFPGLGSPCRRWQGRLSRPTSRTSRSPLGPVRASGVAGTQSAQSQGPGNDFSVRRLASILPIMATGSRARVARRSSKGWRFGSGVTSMPLWLRLAVTIPPVALGALLTRALYVTATAEDSRPAALVLFLLGLLAIWGFVLLPHFWRSSAEWRQNVARLAALNRRIARASSQAPVLTTDSSAWTSTNACSGCGQQGPPVIVRAAQRCPPCQRPVGAVSPL